MTKFVYLFLIIFIQSSFATDRSLIDLIKDGNEQSTLEYIKSHENLNPNFSDKRKRSLLHHAVDADMISVVDVLIEKGAKITLDKRKRHVGFYAIENDNIDLLSKFLEMGIDPLQKEKNGHDLCQYAAYQKSVKSFEFLKNKNLCSIYYNEKKKNNHLTYAIKNNSPKIFEMVLDLEPNSIKSLDPFGNNLLLKAASSDCSECFDILLQRGLSADQENYSGLTIIDVLKYKKEVSYLQKIFQFKVDNEQQVQAIFKSSTGGVELSTVNTDNIVENLNADSAIENFNSDSPSSNKCEDKYPIEKIVKVNIVETPYEVIIKTPVEVTYWATVKVTSTAVKTCWKSFEKIFNKCSIKKPWKCFDVTQIIRVPYDCTVTSVKNVVEKRIKNEFRDEVVGKVKRSIQKLEEYKRPLGYAACVAEKVAEDSAKAVGKSAQAVVDLHEAGIKIATGDKEGAEKAFNRGKNKAKEFVEHSGSAVESTGRAAYDASIGAPLLTLATVSDKTVGSHLVNSYDKRRDKVSREIQKASLDAGVVLEASIQPENLGKIALVYAATSVGGPFGAAMANVLYDKLVLKKTMSERDMLNSFAIGVAAGYAAEGVQGLAEGKEALDAFKHASYLSKMSSSVTRNLVTDAGNIVLNDQGYSSKDFFSSLASGVSVVEVGNDFTAGVIESTIEGGLQSVSTQAVHNNLNLDDIDFKKVEMAVYQGFADGITREAVHGMMDATLLKALPDEWRRVDKKALEAMSEAFYQALLAYENYKQQERVNFALQSLMAIDEIEREALLDSMNKVDLAIKEEVAQNIYGKSFDQLSAKEIFSDNFKNQYQANLIIAGHELVKVNESFANVIAMNKAFSRNPASAAEILKYAGPATTTVLTIVGGDLAVIEPTDAIPAKWAALLIVLGGAMITDAMMSEDQSLEVLESQIPKPSSDDTKGWELYNRALKGDRAAYSEYVNGDYDEAASKRINLIGHVSTGRTSANNLSEKLAMEEVVSNPSGFHAKKMKMNDPRYPAESGWIKMEQVVITKEGSVKIHYLKNTKTGATADFKFVD